VTVTVIEAPTPTGAVQIAAPPAFPSAAFRSTRFVQVKPPPETVSPFGPGASWMFRRQQRMHPFGGVKLADAMFPVSLGVPEKATTLVSTLIGTDHCQASGVPKM
jgi:hypothetical protein